MSKSHQYSYYDSEIHYEEDKNLEDNYEGDNESKHRSRKEEDEVDLETLHNLSMKKSQKEDIHGNFSKSEERSKGLEEGELTIHKLVNNKLGGVNYASQACDWDEKQQMNLLKFLQRSVSKPLNSVVPQRSQKKDGDKDDSDDDLDNNPNKEGFNLAPKLEELSNLDDQDFDSQGDLVNANPEK
jgi:hypothetical protein